MSDFIQTKIGYQTNNLLTEQFRIFSSCGKGSAFTWLFCGDVSTCGSMIRAAFQSRSDVVSNPDLYSEVSPFKYQQENGPR
jgi:hypothetical protein